MKEFTQAHILVLLWRASGSNYVPQVHLQIVDFSNLYFWPLAYGAAVPLSGRLACFHGRAKHILCILGIRDFPPQVSSRQADRPWNVATLMWSACLLQKVFCCCADKMQRSPPPDWKSILQTSPSRLFHSSFCFFCLSPQSVRSAQGAAVNIEWGDGRCPGYF